MPNVSFAFFALAALYGLGGMEWGSQMGSSGDHATLAGHAHLNLLGWVNMALMGTFYALVAGRYPRWLAWLNFVLTGLGAAAVATAMAYLFARGDKSFEPLVIAGSIASMAGMASFLAAIFLSWRNSVLAARTAPSG